MARHQRFANGAINNARFTPAFAPSVTTYGTVLTESGHQSSALVASDGTSSVQQRARRPASGVAETWTHYASVEDARAGATVMYHNDRVLRVMLVNDSANSFVEWVEC